MKDSVHLILHLIDFGVSRSNIIVPAIYFTSAWKFATVVGLTELMAH